MEIALEETVALEARLARLASMPADVDAAIWRVKQQIRSACAHLGTPGTRLVPIAVYASIPHLPGFASNTGAEVDRVLHALDAVLPHRHPEEIRVACFALLCDLVERVRVELGAPRAVALVESLERAPD